MITNIDIDEELIAEAMKISGARTKREAVDRALRELIARSRRPRFRDLATLFETDPFVPGYDPKNPSGQGAPAGAIRIEEPRAEYKAAPPLAIAKRTPRPKTKAGR